MTVHILEVETGSVLGFGPNDLKGVIGPHNDALIIHALIANYNVGKVFMDTDSSVNILYWTVLEQMEIKLVDDLQSISTSLFGFSG